MATKTYQITSSAGVDMGTYNGSSEVEALDALARDAGYRDAVEAAEVVGPFDGIVREVATKWYTDESPDVAHAREAGRAWGEREFDAASNGASGSFAAIAIDALPLVEVTEGEEDECEDRARELSEYALEAARAAWGALAASEVIRITVEHVAASVPAETSTGVEHGLDVDVTVTLSDGTVLEGEVTLLPCEDGRPYYWSWGSADHWVSGRLLRELSSRVADLRAALDTIAAAASGECTSPG